MKQRRGLIYDIGSNLSEKSAQFGGNIYTDIGLEYNILLSIREAELIRIEEALDFRHPAMSEFFAANYHNTTLSVHLRHKDRTHFNSGNVFLTDAGLQLASICGKGEEIPGFKEFVIDRWTELGYTITPHSSSPDAARSVIRVSPPPRYR